MKKIFALIMSLTLLLSCFAGCSEDGKNNDNGIFDDPNNQGNNTAVSRIPVAEQLTNIGAISYDYYCKSLYDSNVYGDYSKYLDTELFLYNYNNKYGYADEKGNVRIQEQYDNAGTFSESKAFVKKAGIWSVIDTTGKTLYTLPTTQNADWSSALFQNGLAIAIEKVEVGYNHWNYKMSILTSNFKFHTVNIENMYQAEVRIINTPEFAGVLTYYLTSKANSSSSTGYDYTDVYTLYDTTGRKVWTVSDEKQKALDNYIYRAGYSKLDSNEALHLAPFVVRDGYINVPNADGQWGLLDIRTNRYQINCSYEYLGGISEGLIPVSVYGKWGYIDINGAVKIQPAHKFTTTFANGRAIVITTDKIIAVIDVTGTVVARPNIKFDDSEFRIFKPSEKSDITVLLTGHYVNLGYKMDAYILDNYGNVLVYEAECSTLYISENHIFAKKPSKFANMYKISKK